VRQLKYMTYPKIHLHEPFEKFVIVVVPLRKPMVPSLSSMLGSSMHVQ
jgi:hypothetical protein